MLKTLAFTLGALALTGCTALIIPADRLERNQASIRSAEELGAKDVPAAQLHLQMAKEQSEQARRMAAKGDERGLSVLTRSDADAELAVVLAREATTHADATKAAEDLKALRTRATP